MRAGYGLVVVGFGNYGGEVSWGFRSVSGDGRRGGGRSLAAWAMNDLLLIVYDGAREEEEIGGE